MKRGAVVAVVVVAAIAVAVPVLAWVASPSSPTVKHTVRAALCERGRASPGPRTPRIIVKPRESVSLDAVLDVIGQAESRCCPEPRAASSRADARAEVRAWKLCNGRVAAATGMTNTAKGALVPTSRRVVVTLGPRAVRDDRRRVAAFLRRSELVERVEVCCPAE